MKFIVSAAALVVIAAGIKATSALLIPLVLAGFLAIITFPLVRWLQEHRVHRLAAVLITMLAVLGALLGPGLLVATAIRQFAQAAPEYETRLRQLVLASGGWLRDRNIDATHLSTILDPSLIFGFVVTTLSGVLTLLSIVFLVVLVSAFLLMESADVADRRSEALPGRAREMIAAVGRQMQVWLWVKTLISLATGAAAGLWVGLMGIEFALLWGLVAFLLNYIPNFGSLIAALPPALLALIQDGPLSAAVVALGYVVINVVFGSVLEPYFMGRQIGLSPVVVLLSVIVWGWLWGPIGMLLAVPITMSVKFGLESSSESRWLGRLLGGNTG
ncbi:MAG: AI-2E family transporter [Acidobacteria bacterium]|nr:AI-2E family transporter [Acidobacteriota bacterium]